MSTPDEIIRQQLDEGLDVTGTVAMDQLGVSDQAGASAPPAELDLSKATAMNPDVEALEARIKAQQAAQSAAAEPAPVEPEANPAPSLSGSVASDVRAAFDYLHDRLSRLERLAGL